MFFFQPLVQMLAEVNYSEKNFLPFIKSARLPKNPPNLDIYENTTQEKIF